MPDPRQDSVIVSLVEKEYVDRGVQANPPSLHSGLVEPSDHAQVLVASGVGTNHANYTTLFGYSDRSISKISSPSNEDHSAYSHSFLPDSPTTPIRATLISRRVPKRKALPHSRPSEFKWEDKRVVSMPENVAEYAPTSPGRRIVSMPEALRPAFEPSNNSLYSPSSGDSFGSIIENRNRIRVKTPADVPRTPSPPSSPESVLIINGNARLPDAFLRRIHSPEPDNSEEEDWITWASSPPKPIPALHGPLSLPYARCPSGAEGTIIEESDNLSRIIWGLGSGDHSANNAPIGPSASNNDTSHTLPLQARTLQVPPRLQRKPVPSLHYYPQTRSSISTEKHINTKESETRDDLAHPTPPTLAVPRADPTPSVTERDALSRDANAWRPVYTAKDHAKRDQVRQYMQHQDIDENLLLDWKAMTLADQHLKDTAVNYPDSRKADIAGFLPSHVQVPPIYPRIFVERRPNEYVASVNTPRQSAMAIAKQYRTHLQQQLRQKQQQMLGLPTPPNSSSPQWSSNFSPYQGTSFSPDMDLLQNSGFANNGRYISLHNQHSSSDSSHHFRRLVHERITNSATTAQVNSHHSNGPLDHVDQTLNALSAHSPRSDISSQLARYLFHLNALSSQNSLVLPISPGPPPSVPLPPVPSNTNGIPRGSIGGRPPSYRGTMTAAPPSPESPDARLRSTSHQQLRSVPLARLMQNRLSSVPEEDPSTNLQSSPSSSQWTRERQRTRSSQNTDFNDHSPAQRPERQHQYLKVPPTSYRSRTSSPESVTSNGEYDTRAYTPYHGTSPARVRLPYLRKQDDYEDRTNFHAPSRVFRDDNSTNANYQAKRKPRGRKPRGPSGHGFGRGQRPQIPA
ncbi:hypothetical protein BJ138DRAFT_569059 [Hygrophoropsis aurantiaca]|uniref:Uncharacterized protein n=1 Tax=Hygrophoropsis aurantiaca TaxID=72124 RepID=A0ACB8AM57_9AGAM|nr:hypothetical protein BJ138DRAFT_569059 [Hygrophoropsis aurantiaca]